MDSDTIRNWTDRQRNREMLDTLGKKRIWDQVQNPVFRIAKRE